MLYTRSILVIGSTGFLGKNFLKLILKKKLKITCISFNNKIKIKSNKIKQIQCDISDYNLLKKKLINKKFDYVINFSGYVDHSNFRKNGRNIINSHLIGVVNILSILDISKIKHFIHIGSSEEYGLIKPPQKAKDIGEAYTPYSYSKQSVTNLLKMLKFNENLKFTVVRVFLVYGPGQSNERVIPYIIENCLKNKKFYLTSGSQLRDFIYIDDLIKGIYAIMRSNKIFGNVINLSSGKPISIKNITEKIKSKIGYGNPVYGKRKKRKYENLSLYADVKINDNYIKWSPKTSLDIGLNKTIKYYSKNV